MEITKEMYGGIGTVIGALIALFGVTYKQNIDKKRKTIDYLCSQLSSYYELERLYSEKVSSLSADRVSPIRVKVLMRNQVEDQLGLERPAITRSKIRNILGN